MTYEAFKNRVTDEAESRGITEYELYYTGIDTFEVNAVQHELDGFSLTSNVGVTFRCLIDGKMGYASTELLNEEQALELVGRAAENARTLENPGEMFLYGGGDPYTAISDFNLPLPAPDRVRTLVLDSQEKLYQADPRVCDGTSSEFMASEASVRLFNSRGLNLENHTSSHFCAMGAILQEGEEKYVGSAFWTNSNGTLSVDSLVKEAVKKAERTIGAIQADSGKYTVVLSPEVMRGLLAIFTPAFSADNAQKGLSLLNDKEGQQIASSQVTLIDDPFYPGSTAQTPFDGEGYPTKRKQVVEKGCLTTLLHNMKTAAKADRKSTGNACRPSYNSDVTIAPYRFYLEPGSASPQELYKQVGEGIYITEIEGGHAGADPVSGDFSLQSKGFLIEKGKCSKAVREITIADNFFELLKKITQIGNDLKFGGSGGYTVFGAPSVVVTDLSVAGK